jgi:putative FmdB family regulatory protein
MPLFNFQCRTCDKTSELLVMVSDTPECPHCGSDALDKLISRPAAPGRSNDLVGAARRQAAKEGHFSNYSRAERGKAKG